MISFQGHYSDYWTPEHLISIADQDWLHRRDHWCQHVRRYSYDPKFHTLHRALGCENYLTPDPCPSCGYVWLHRLFGLVIDLKERDS